MNTMWAGTHDPCITSMSVRLSELARHQVWAQTDTSSTCVPEVGSKTLSICYRLYISNFSEREHQQPQHLIYKIYNNVALFIAQYKTVGV